RRLEGGIGRARTTVLVVSPLSMSRPWVNEEINAAIARAVAGEQRLIPVLLGDVDLPPFIAGRAWIDFRYVDSPDEYKRRFGELVRAIRGSPPGQRPEPGGEIVTPDLPARPEGPDLR
ncbi:MAG: toll/interleukin-1 receptor domain-containing protein, partial [Streptosporangiaceae bacterium]